MAHPFTLPTWESLANTYTNFSAFAERLAALVDGRLPATRKAVAWKVRRASKGRLDYTPEDPRIDDYISRAVVRLLERGGAAPFSEDERGALLFQVGQDVFKELNKGKHRNKRPLRFVQMDGESLDVAQYRRRHGRRVGPKKRAE